MAEERLQKSRKPLKPAALPAQIARVADIAPILRGAVAIERNAMAGTVKRQILCFRTNPTILNYVSGADLARYSQVGVVTPDHTIRTKNWPLIVPAPDAHKLDEWKTDVYAAVIPGLDYQPAVHVHYQETRLRIKDGLPKMKDVPKPMGGSGEVLAE